MADSPVFSSVIDTGLPARPYGVPDELNEQFQAIFNAIRIIQQKVGDLSGAGVLDPTNYLALSPLFSESIQIQRMQAIIVVASEAIAANDFVNLWNSSGLKVRKAYSTTIGSRAWGWAPQAIANGAAGIIYLFSGYQVGSGLTVGTTYYLSATTPGGITTTAPVASGTIKQEVGIALSTTELLIQLSTPIINP